MTFDADEASSQSNRPLEFATITHGTTTYRIACGIRDLAYGGFVYTATPSARSEIVVVDANTGTPSEVSLSLPVNHPLVLRYLLNGTPPAVINVTIQRLQQVSGEVDPVWIGQVQSMSVDGVVAKFLIPSQAQMLFQRSLPTITVDTLCAHVLYDSMCRADQPTFTVTTTVISVSGNIVRVDMGAGHRGIQWAQFGTLKHIASGEMVAVLSQDDVEPSGPSNVADLTMEFLVAGLVIGDTVEVSAGCAHDIGTCFAKFANQVNFGGLPQRTTGNIFSPTGLGILVRLGR